MDNNPIEDQLKRLAAQGGPCIRCGKPAEVVGMFVPNDDEKYYRSPIKGKKRSYFYFVCNDCSQLPDATDFAERWVSAHIAHEINPPYWNDK